MIFAREHVTALWSELAPLLVSCYREVGLDQDVPLNPDAEGYAGLERVGILRCYTVRDGGRLVGLAVFTLCDSPHRRGFLMASHDLLYVHPQHRSLPTAMQFLRFTEEQLRADGARIVYQSTKHAKPYGKLLERLHYRPTDVIYSKRLDQDPADSLASAVDASMET